jgi:NAD(P)-dependent dehydrogenase (short-subunit alcohol dehydrogenase family)
MPARAPRPDYNDPISIIAHQPVAAQIESDGSKALTIELDLSNPTAAQTVIERSLTALGRIDALLNIAGAVPGLVKSVQVTLRYDVDRLLEIWDNRLAHWRGEQS